MSTRPVNIKNIDELPYVLGLEMVRRGPLQKGVQRC